MTPRAASERLSEALVRATGHWEARHAASAAEKGGGPPRAFTIAFSREVGARGTTVAREVGRRLNWPVYDRELVERIAQEMGLRASLLESVDERHAGWLRETLAALSSAPQVSESAFVRHLIQTVLSLGSHGQCVIVGRGAAHILPAATTLRVRLVAPLDERIAVLAGELSVSKEEAARQIKGLDDLRRRFLRDHFGKDPADPLQYDMVLNSGRFTVGECAELVLEALCRLQGRPSTGLRPEVLMAARP